VIPALVVALLATSEDAESLRATAPAYLDLASAREHYAAARVAGAIFDVDPELLLAISWHESRYVANVVTREPGRRVSCGVMTPVPHRRSCSAWELSILGGYIEGARHLRVWIDKCGGDRSCGMTAYAGGGGLVAACRAGSGHRGCYFAGQMTARSRRIARRRLVT